MTKEDLYNEFTNEGTCTNSFAFKLLNEFFESNVVIPKGTNRHPDADVLHEFVEDVSKTIQVYQEYNKYWEDARIELVKQGMGMLFMLCALWIVFH